MIQRHGYLNSGDLFPDNMNVITAPCLEIHGKDQRVQDETPISFVKLPDSVSLTHQMK